MVVTETVNQGNTFGVVSDDEIPLDKLLDETKWSDHNLVIPLLFDFYHGVEVVLKGFLAARGKLGNKNHKLSRLLQTFSAEFPGTRIESLLRKYILTEHLVEPLQTFCARSNISIDDYYQALKYPESQKGDVYRHSPLKYRGCKGLTFFEQLGADINVLRKETVSLGRCECPGA